MFPTDTWKVHETVSQTREKSIALHHIYTSMKLVQEDSLCFFIVGLIPKENGMKGKEGMIEEEGNVYGEQG